MARQLTNEKKKNEDYDVIMQLIGQINMELIQIKDVVLHINNEKLDRISLSKLEEKLNNLRFPEKVELEKPIIIKEIEYKEIEKPIIHEKIVQVDKPIFQRECVQTKKEDKNLIYLYIIMVTILIMQLITFLRG